MAEEGKHVHAWYSCPWKASMFCDGVFSGWWVLWPNGSNLLYDLFSFGQKFTDSRKWKQHCIWFSNVFMGGFVWFMFIAIHLFSYSIHLYLFRTIVNTCKLHPSLANGGLKSGVQVHYERGRRPSEFSLNMRIFSSWATDRDAFQRLISFEPSYRLTNGFRHLKATINKSFVLA